MAHKKQAAGKNGRDSREEVSAAPRPGGHRRLIIVRQEARRSSPLNVDGPRTIPFATVTERSYSATGDAGEDRSVVPA
jgi:hypothetical protein